MTNRQFYQSIGICPVCRKEKLFGDEKECQECQAKRYSRVLNWRSKHPGYDKAKRMEVYYKRVRNHECTLCGKLLDETYKFQTCPKCRIKTNLNLRKSRERRGLNGI